MKSATLNGALNESGTPYLTLPYQEPNHGAAPPSLPDTPERRNLRDLLDSGNTEIRAFEPGDKGRVWSGVFDDYSVMRKELIYAMHKGMDIYTTLNPLKIPAVNNIRPYRRSARDSDVSRITRIPFDFDPVRETGTAATDEQVSEAVSQADRLIVFLGWPEPLIGLSGNGAHLIYKTDLPNSPETAKALQSLYAALSLRFSTDAVKFDTVVRNPSRVFRCYGTKNNKAGRKSQCFVPGEWLPVAGVVELAEKLTPKRRKATWVKPAHQERAGEYVKNWDIAGAFRAAGLYLQETKDAGKSWVICPWECDHTETGGTDTVIWEGQWPQFHCSHNHCSHRSVKDVIVLLGVRDAVA